MKRLRDYLNKFRTRISAAVRWYRRRLPLLLALIFVGVVVIPLLYFIPGFGIGTYTDAAGVIVPQKTFWDWLDLLIVPLFLLIGGVWINSSIQRREREIADDRLKEQALQNYLDRMSELLLKERLGEPKVGDKAKTVARARTLTVLRGLDGERKGAVLRFLYESQLITDNTATLDLRTADFTDARLLDENLEGANLEGVNFEGANLEGANLGMANLKWTNLKAVNLKGAHLRFADLAEANLQGADLQGAIYAEERLQTAILDENTILPDGSHYKPPVPPQ